MIRQILGTLVIIVTLIKQELFIDHHTVSLYSIHCFIQKNYHDFGTVEWGL